MTTPRTPQASPCPLLGIQPDIRRVPFVGIESPIPVTDEILHNILTRKLVTAEEMAEMSLYSQEDFYGVWEGDPDAWLANKALPRIWIEVKGEKFPLIRPSEFEAFLNLICDEGETA